jgi:hypothetical protein
MLLGSGVVKRSAILAFPDAAGEPQARLLLERGGGPFSVAWLMCNPSLADDMVDDPTAKRVVRHSRNAGYGRSLVGNIWPLRTPYPPVLWERLAAGAYTAEMRDANLDMLAAIGAQASLVVVAFGATPGRQHLAAVREAVGTITLGRGRPLYCLGTTSDGWPLHPLARGRMAIRNDTPLRRWEWPV